MRATYVENSPTMESGHVFEFHFNGNSADWGDYLDTCKDAVFWCRHHFGEESPTASQGRWFYDDINNEDIIRWFWMPGDDDAFAFKIRWC